MNKRNSKDTLLAKIDELNARLQCAELKLEAVFEAGQYGIAHVGAANYAYRQEEAEEKLNKAYYGY